MITLAKDTVENLVVDVEDRLDNLPTLDGTNVKYHIRHKYADDDFVVENQTATTVDLQAFCLIDTTDDDLFPRGQYELFLSFTDLPEVPRLGPMEFEIV